MIKMALVLLLSVFGCLLAHADEVPPIILCEVQPWDSMEFPRAIFAPNRDQISNDATIRVTITDDMHRPLPGLFVEAIAGECWRDVCVCTGAVLTGYTDDAGRVTLNLAGGGCCSNPRALELRANSVTVRVMDTIVSPDWDGQSGDCSITVADFAVFCRNFIAGGPGCSDLSGDGRTDTSDFVIFSRNWGRFCTMRD